MTAKPSLTPAAAPAAVLAAVLATPWAQDARAQARLAVGEEVLTERIHRDLSGLLRETAPTYGLGPESIRFTFPDSSYLTAAAALGLGAGVVYAVGVPMVAAGGAVAGGVILLAFWNGDVEDPPPGVHGHVETIVFVDDHFLEKVIDNALGDIRDFALDGHSFVEGYLKDRVEVHYRLKGLHGRGESGSCLAFFALTEGPDGSQVLRYALDACSHDQLFPQEVPTEGGDMRIGPDGVDVWDKILGQDMVVAKGSIPVP